MDILVIKEYFGNLILTGNKTWEVRNTNTKKRGTISIAYSGTNKRFGTVELVDSFPLTKELFDENFFKHHNECSWDELLESYNHPYAWVMENPKLYSKPIPYEHPHGAVVWVKS